MAKFTIGIETLQTGPLVIEFPWSEERAQDIFAMFLGTAAPITETVSVPDPTPEKPDRIRNEQFKRPRKLGECLKDEARGIATGIEKRALDYKREQAAKAAQEAITDKPEL